MLVLNEKDLIGLAPPSEIIDAVEAALRAHSAGSIVAPARLHLHWDDHTLLAMPAATRSAAAVKVVSVVPSNASRNLPVTTGAMLLSDGTTGAPLAIMNAGALTAQRTGAVGALGAKYYVINPVRAGVLQEKDVFSIAECVMGKRVVDTSRTTAYKTVGAAMYDLFVAEVFYRAAKTRGVGLEVAL